MFSSYGELSAEVYDLSKPIGHSFGDIDYYRDRLKTCKGRILEAAVGTGRMLIPLMESGFIVDGMDASLAMLNVCRLNCASRGLSPQLFTGHMQKFSLPHSYEAIIIPTGSFLLIKDRTESIQALTCFHNQLIPGGKIIIDLFLQTNFDTNTASTRTWITPNKEAITQESKLVEVSLLEQYVVTYSRYEKWLDGKLVMTEMEETSLRWFGIEEFKLVLEHIGFSDVTISSDYVFGKVPTHSKQVFTYEAIRK
ncbi:class I SAM-dependent methyltransferase [Paenibacillus agricola]|uniref:Class I SAM-dependent methyltransferase n=1 Tax=Paenibacillus agricola TaxID=2716264 RepID=A0ABX0J7C1_9BACL|nr:class I SAM-dependent methyltransferase [Paenibacillus agricola]NHN31868.1 class I SAM-dependent methyltransferase [Paenibacillus agricola]